MKYKGIAPLLLLLLVTVAGAGTLVTYKEVESQSQNNTSTPLVQNVKEFLQNSEVILNNNRLKNNNSDQSDPESEEAENNKIAESRNCAKPYQWSTTISQDRINGYLQNGLPGYEFSGYSIEGGKINLKDNGLMATIELNNNKAFYAELKLKDSKKDFDVVKLESTGGNSMNKAELAVIRVALNNADKLVWKYVDDYYKKAFVSIDIFEAYQEDYNRIELMFYTREYLECIGEL